MREAQVGPLTYVILLNLYNNLKKQAFVFPFSNGS